MAKDVDNNDETNQSMNHPNDGRFYPTKPYSWDDLIDIIQVKKDVSLLRRSYEQEQHYQNFRTKILNDYVSIIDYIKIEKFHFPKRFIQMTSSDKQEDENGKMGKWESVNHSTNTSISSEDEHGRQQIEGSTPPTMNSQIILLKNDFPYYFDSDSIEHWIAWKVICYQLSPSHSTEKDSSNSNKILTQEEIETSKHNLLKKFGLLNYTDSQQQQQQQQPQQKNLRLSDVLLHWKNPPHLKSLPEIDHVHFLIRKCSNF